MSSLSKHSLSKGHGPNFKPRCSALGRGILGIRPRYARARPITSAATPDGVSEGEQEIEVELQAPQALSNTQLTMVRLATF